MGWQDDPPVSAQAGAPASGAPQGWQADPIVPKQAAPPAATSPAPQTRPSSPIQEHDEGMAEAANLNLKNPLEAMPGVKRGVGDMYAGAVQFFLHALEAGSSPDSAIGKKARELRQAFDKQEAQGEADYQAQRTQSPDAQTAQQLSAISGQPVGTLDVGRAVGNAIGAAPLAAIAPESLPGRIAAGAATGAAAGVAQPTSTQGPDYWQEKARQAVAGAVGGAAVAPLAGAAARVINPEANAALDTLQGVKPTLGQTLAATGGVVGKGAGRLEEGLTSVPLVGDAIKMGQRGAMEDFNRATINQALAPIGEKLSADTPIGDKAINEMATKIKADRDALAPKVVAAADSQFAQGISGVMQMAQRLPPEKQAQLQKILTNDVVKRFGTNGVVSGQDFMDMQSTIGRLANDYMHSAVVDERNLGRALNEMDDQLSQLLIRTNPDAAKELQANNDAYAMLKRIQAASISSVKSGGVFTPAQLLMAIRNQDSTLGHSAFARGSALMKAYAQTAQEVLGSNVPDSGTAFRWMAEHPISTVLMSPAALPAALANTTLGRNLVRLAFASRPGIAAPVASGVKSLGSVAGGTLAAQGASQ